METIIFLFVLVASLAYIAHPYFKKQTVSPKSKKARSNRLSDLQAQRDTILASIKDLEFDREMGKVSDEDYAQMNTQFRRDAVGILQQIDQSNGKSSAKRALEAELKSLRNQKKSQGKFFCKHCGASVSAQDRFCSSCGEKVR
jgi:rubrerythrin